MKRDLFTEYTCTPVEDIAALAEVGITMQPANGTYCIWPDNDGNWWKELGCIIVWDDTRNIDCIPYHGINTADRGFIVAVAFNAYLAPPDPEKQWGHAISADGRSYWHQIVFAEVRNDDTEARRVIAAIESHRERNDRLLGFDNAA